MAGSTTRIGVLALQGAYREHLLVLEKLGTPGLKVRTQSELSQVDALVIPGGESTVIDKLSQSFGVDEAISARIAGGMPVFGTCAGLIMIADRLTDSAPGQRTFGGLDVTVQRNAYGSQQDSFSTSIFAPEISEEPLPAVFIRAPIVQQLGDGVRVLAEHRGKVVAVQQGNLLGLSYHPELTDSLEVHRYFLKMCS